MFRRSKEADELRAQFVANREKVRSWLATWECPEVEFPEFTEIPAPWIVGPGEERGWLERHAPYLDEYHWLLEGRSVGRGVTHVVAVWQFGAKHAFERLDLEFRSYADPPYLSERLAMGAHTAALKGWQERDLRGVYDWLLAGIDSRPMNEMIRGKHRSGFILFELLRSPHSRTEINVRLRMTLTDTALDGTPLNEQGGIA